jgi:DNA-binding transcriptional MerR regulator
MTMKRVYSIGELARPLNVTPPAVRQWLAAGVIEEPKYEGGGARLFTEEQLARIKVIIAQRRKRRKAHR